MDIFTIKQWLFLMILCLVALSYIGYKILHVVSRLKRDNEHIYKGILDIKEKLKN